MKDRIKHYIEHKGISAGELSVLLDVQRSNISHILNGRNKPGAVFIEKLLKAFPDLNARWLLTGDGVMHEGSDTAIKVQNNTLPFSVDTKPETKLEPELNVKEKESNPEPIDQASSSVGSNDDVEKMILIFKDGTFVTYQNRGNK